MREGFGGFTQGVPDAVRRALLELKRLLDDGISTLSTYVTPGVWQTATLQNAWVKHSAAYPTAQYRKEGDNVRVRGLIKSGTMSGIIFTLPVGYRPALSAVQSVGTYNTFGHVTIAASTGEVSFSAGSNVYLSLDFTFSTT